MTTIRCFYCGEPLVGSTHDCEPYHLAVAGELEKAKARIAELELALRLSCEHEAEVLLQLPKQFRMSAEEIHNVYMERARKESK